jgi:hypothetical protein
MSLYAELLRAAYPDHKVKAALLWTQTAKLTWLSDEFLIKSHDRALLALELEGP